MGASDAGVILRFIEYMDVGHTNGWRLDEVVPADELVAAIDAELPLEAPAGQVPREVADRWRYREAAACRGRRHRVGQPAVLRRLHAGSDLGRGQALHVPLLRRWPRPVRAVVRSEADRRRPAGGDRPVWRVRDDRSPSCEPRPRPTCRGSRCSRWAGAPQGRATAATAASSTLTASPTRDGQRFLFRRGRVIAGRVGDRRPRYASSRLMAPEADDGVLPSSNSAGFETVRAGHDLEGQLVIEPLEASRGARQDRRHPFVTGRPQRRGRWAAAAARARQ